jgi:hypothetical protein
MPIVPLSLRPVMMYIAAHALELNYNTCCLLAASFRQVNFQVSVRSVYSDALKLHNIASSGSILEVPMSHIPR